MRKVMESREFWHPILLSCCHNLKSSGKNDSEKRDTKNGGRRLESKLVCASNKRINIF